MIKLGSEVLLDGGKGVEGEGGVVCTAGHGETWGEESHGVLEDGGLVQAQVVEQLVTKAQVITKLVRFELLQ